MTAPARIRSIADHPLLLQRSRFEDAVAAVFSPALVRPGTRSQATREIKARRRYALSNDPWAYFADILGLTLTQQQDDVVESLLIESRLLIPSGNNVGKTFLLAGWGIYRFDAVGALEDDETGEPEQGARILLPGPDHETVFKTIYAEILTLANRAELRGHLMPGDRSDRSVLWQVRPKWDMEAFSPPQRVAQQVSHTASGRHHRNQIALVEEGQGVPETVWRGVEGMCSSEGNQIVSSFNPTEPVGPAYQRATNGTYRVIHLSALDHPNIIHREPRVPAAVDFRVIDKRVRADCRDRGAYPGTPIEAEHNDFVYALPDVGAREQRARKDDIRGARGALPRVYRPGTTFTAQVMGLWPASNEDALFSAGHWDAGVQRWKSSRDPDKTPDRIGADVAREGDDESIDAPAWGPTAEAALRAYFEAELAGPDALEKVRREFRIRIGDMHVLAKGDGVVVAQQLHRRWPSSPITTDEGGVGASPYDHLTRVLRRDVAGVSFAAVAHPPINDSEPWSENLRTQLYVRAALAVNRGLVDPPNDPILREEILAHYVIHGAKTVERKNRTTGYMEKVRVASVALPAKDEIKKLIGRSPDRADTFVLALYGAPRIRRKSHMVPASQSYLTV
jgi:hypothetical protein